MSKLTNDEANEILKDYIQYKLSCHGNEDSLDTWLKSKSIKREDFPIGNEKEEKKYTTYKIKLNTNTYKYKGVDGLTDIANSDVSWCKNLTHFKKSSYAKDYDIPDSMKETYKIGQKIVTDYGIEEVVSVSDHFCESRLIIPKDIFIEAYNKFINK